MKKLTHRILSCLISFDNCNTSSNEQSALKKIVELCTAYGATNSCSYGNKASNNSEGDSSKTLADNNEFNIPEGFEPINIPNKIGDLAGYYVNRNGEIWSIKTRMILKQSLNANGYYHFGYMSKAGKLHFVQTHRAVACTFLENPYGYCFVRHKDGDKSNNNVENLQWHHQIRHKDGDDEVL